MRPSGLVLLAMITAATAVPAAAATAPTELDCVDQSDSSTHWGVVLNENEGTATLATYGPGRTGDAGAKTSPAAFGPNEVVITVDKGVFGIDVMHSTADTFYIDRTTLRWKYEDTMDGKVMGVVGSGQCQIVTHPDRKF